MAHDGSNGRNATAKALTTDDIIKLALIYLPPVQSKLSLTIATAIAIHAKQFFVVLKKRARGAMVVASSPQPNADGSKITVDIQILPPPNPQFDIGGSKVLESARLMIDDINLTTTCVAYGHIAAEGIEHGQTVRPKVYEATEPMSGLVEFDEHGDLRVARSPLRYVKPLKRLLDAAGELCEFEVGAHYNLAGSAGRFPDIPRGATKVQRVMDQPINEVAQVTGFLARSRIVEVDLLGKVQQLEVPENFCTLISQAAKADAWVSLSLERYTPTNPCLPDAPVHKIVSVDAVLEQGKFEM